MPAPALGEPGAAGAGVAAAMMCDGRRVLAEALEVLVRVSEDGELLKGWSRRTTLQVGSWSRERE